jgi:N-formylglutamate amidohydrolase
VQPSFTFGGPPSPLLATAIHAGHELRSEIAARSALDVATRLREEDPFTDRLTDLGGARIIAHRSRFEVDLNRPRERAVYRVPDDAWGLELWREPLAAPDVEESLHLYDDFYAELARHLDGAAARGPFLVLDLHSYNHRRDGAGAPPAPTAENPDVNVGTGSLDRERWGDLVDRFLTELGGHVVRDRRLDVRENVRFQGGELSRWVDQQYGDRGCALAIEFKKTFMDEWTGVADDDHLEELRRALAAVVPSVLVELESVSGPR